MPKGRPKANAGTLADDRPDYRRCLGGCGKSFFSKGPGNRVCRKCVRVRAGNAGLSRRQVEVFADVRRGK